MAARKVFSDKKQVKRFIEAARKAGTSEDDRVFDENMRQIVKSKPKGTSNAARNRKEALMPGSPAKPTCVSFGANKRDFSTSIEAFIWLVNRFLAMRPDILDNQRQRDSIADGRGRRYFSRTPNELFKASPHLAEEMKFQPLPGGWFANTNINNEIKLQVLSRLSKFSGFNDWSWDDGDKARDALTLIIDATLISVCQVRNCPNLNPWTNSSISC